MQFLYNYTNKAQQKLLSNRLNHLCMKNLSTNQIGGTTMKSENLKYNFSFVISHIILNPKFTWQVTAYWCSIPSPDKNHFLILSIPAFFAAQNFIQI